MEDKKLLDKIEKKIIQILKKEGGAAGLEPILAIANKLGVTKSQIKKVLNSIGKVKKHTNGDYILTPINEKAKSGKRPDYADVDGDGDEEESMEKAFKDKEKMDEAHCTEQEIEEGHCYEEDMSERKNVGKGGKNECEKDSDCKGMYDGLCCDNGKCSQCISFEKPKSSKKLEESVIKRLQKLANIK